MGHNDFFIIGLIFIRLSSLKVALLVAIATISIETSQLYHAPWIDVIRMTRGLSVGYLVGILLIERSSKRKNSSKMTYSKHKR
ncbi:DUF2809 domain-containing protein [Wukongibacter sp. M2B1]|uniref:DUF2809 domain-containing protein n=1 Tax=Wukongibacter sp. M2B1 TaxID=3088895 RepID=UPI003D7AE87F